MRRFNLVLQIEMEVERDLWNTKENIWWEKEPWKSSKVLGNII